MTPNNTMTETEKTVLRILEKIQSGDLKCVLSDGIIKVLINGTDLWIGHTHVNINGVVIPTYNKDITKTVSIIIGKMYDKRNIDTLAYLNKVLDGL